jgi:outer membrane protein TolC
MMRGRLATPVAFAFALASRSVLGQSTAPPPATTTVPSPATTAPASAPLPAVSVPDLPPSPTVSDPMLTPIPVPRRFIASWEEAATLLRARSTDLRRAYDDVKRAEASSRTALAQVLPTLNGTGTLTHTILPSAGSTTVDFSSGQVTGSGADSFAASLRASLTLVNAQAWHQIGTAHVNEASSRLSYEDLERTTAASLATAIAQNVTAERVSELGRVGLQNALERLALAEAKERTGSATMLDIVRARQDVANARSSLVTSDETLRQSREALGLAVGITEPVGVTPSTDLSTIGQGVLKACRALPDLEQRPDVLAANKNLEIARRQRTEVDLGFLPTLSVGSTLGATWVDNGPANGTTWTERTTWNVQAVLNVPIWDGGARYGARRNAAAIADQSAASLEALRRNSSVALVQARRSVEVAEESRRVAEEARNLALEVDRMTRLAYQTGKGTSLDLVTSAEALRQAEVSLALQELALVQARINSLLTLANCSVAK